MLAGIIRLYLSILATYSLLCHQGQSKLSDIQKEFIHLAGIPAPSDVMTKNEPGACCGRAQKVHRKMSRVFALVSCTARELASVGEPRATAGDVDDAMSIDHGPAWHEHGGCSDQRIRHTSAKRAASRPPPASKPKNGKKI